MNVVGVLHLALLLGLNAITSAENIDADSVDRFCYPEEYQNTRKSCECSNVSASPWGMRSMHIDCSYKDFKTSDFSQVLPLYVDTLDLSWNALNEVPVFASDSLRQLNLMHNNITSLTSKNFIKVSNLRELYLSWNSIQSVSLKSFEDLAHLLVLDLSHNNLMALPFQIFAPLLIIESLSLSWNRQLNQSEGIQELDFYQNYGVRYKLRTLKLDACTLTTVVIPEKASLIELSLRRNLLAHVPPNLPSSLEKLDLSENPFESLILADKANSIQELYLEDMPRLQFIAENAFVPFQALKKISFQNSRRLSSFHAFAFGDNATKWPPLRTMIFRGTAMHTFNSTLSPVFTQLTELDLNGLPLHCDCELIWLKEQLKIETNGRCSKPSRLRGMRLSSANIADFSCDTWPRWVYGIITLGLIILCSAGIYLIVMGLRPTRGVTMRRKVGAGSPYARVTIEPNRQEANYY